MKILITGAYGQLGSELAHCLASGKTELGDVPASLQNAQVVLTDVDTLDITNLAQVQAFVGECKPDAIISCAAYTNVDGCEAHRDDAFCVNALGARNLAMAAEVLGAKLVHVSTDYVFSGNGDAPQPEWTLPSPKSAYGSTKLLGEQYVSQFCTRAFIVRTAWLYGYRGKNFVKTIRNAAFKVPKLTVVDDQIGNPTNAADVAHHLLKLLDTQEYGLYHCTGTGVCSWYDFACEIVRLSGAAASVAPCTSAEYAAAHPDAASRPAYSALDNMMLRNTVGDEMRGWKEALTCYFEHWNAEEDQ